MRLPFTYRKSMRSYFYTLGIILITIIGLQILRTLLRLLSGHGFSGVSISSLRSDVFGPFVAVECVLLSFYYLVVPYREFKLGIQNGQTRRQIWLSQVMGLVTITLLGWLLWLLSTDFHSLSTTSTFGMLLVLFTGTTFTYALGSGFALLPRMWKIIVGIAVPTIWVIIMAQVVKLLVKFWRPTTATLDTLANLVNSQGILFLLGIIWVAIMLGISYLFTMRLQLRRD